MRDKDIVVCGKDLMEYAKDSAVPFGNVETTWRLMACSPALPKFRPDTDDSTFSPHLLDSHPVFDPKITPKPCLDVQEAKIKAAKFSARMRKLDQSIEDPKPITQLQYEDREADAKMLTIDSRMRILLYASQMDVDDYDLSKTVRPFDFETLSTSHMSVETVQDASIMSVGMLTPEEAAIEAMKFSLLGNQVSNRLAGRAPTTPHHDGLHFIRDWMM
ncbi:hypothetical protein B0A48_17306 [Cryoendolithus antarcticus]|uniref:Uncharacterized protein n=1 Tax=Cryoendolithus antarcticus TaxID=1507870 RepID=A0A1V8SBZ1_9PEZI|nr:hypothetical protein B0A48_17306 [Cryoendolithus antarcticus]